MTPIFEHIKDNATIKPRQDWVYENYKGSDRLILKNTTLQTQTFTRNLLEIIINRYQGTVTLYRHKSGHSSEIPIADPDLFSKLIEIVEAVP